MTTRPTRPQTNKVAACDRLAGDDADLAPADVLRRDREADDRQRARRDQALVERAHDRVVGAELDEERADDRGDDAGAADRERIEHQRGEIVLAGEEDRGEHHGRHDGHRIGLEQVGGHARAVADIVADVVGDGRRVARIVLGNAGLDLADEVGADVGALGEDAAAETGEDRDQRGAEAERDERVDHFAVRRAVAERSGQNREIAGDAEQREARDEQASHRPGAEGDVETARQRIRRGLGGAHIGANRNVHADEARGAGKNRADEKAERHEPTEQNPQQNEHDDSDACDGRVLAAQIGLRAFGDRGGDFLHSLGARRRRQELADRVSAVDDR